MLEDIVVVRSRTSSLGVLAEEGHSGEGLTAVGTGILLHLGVGLEVSPQVGAVCEGPVAVLAGEWLLSSVSPDVSLEEPRSGEGLPAELALAGESVRSDVHLECTQRDVHLLAVLAAECLLGGGVLVGRAVELLVLREARVRRVGLGAEVALVAGRVLAAFPRGPGPTASDAGWRRQVLRGGWWLAECTIGTDGAGGRRRAQASSESTVSGERDVQRSRLRKGRQVLRRR